MDFKDKKIAIIGLGVEGLSSAVYLAKKGAHVTVLDKKSQHEFEKATLEELEKNNISWVFGEEYLKNLSSFELLVRSPGVRPDAKEVQEARQIGVKITSQTQLFLEYCPCLVIGITGTKGKGTTSTLVYEILKKSGFDAYLGGNIGLPPFEFLDTLSAQSRVVLELSSFQLQDVTISPHIAVVLMITSEHLDYHTNHKEYLDAKRNILRFQTKDDFAVINRDYPISNESDIYTEGKVFQVSRERSSTEQGCFIKDDAVWISMKGTEWKVIDIKDIKLVGKHNLENVCAAALAATLSGAEKVAIASVLRSFVGLEHRLELVRDVNGVTYYDDSFSTTPETAIAAIEAFENPEILILGGSSKKSDFIELGKVIRESKNIKAIIGIGEEWEMIKRAINYSSSERSESRSSDNSSPQGRTIKPLLIEGAKDMKTVVQAAAKIANPGDVVLLTPACASFDMFRNYKERGNQFKEEVKKIEL